MANQNQQNDKSTSGSNSGNFADDRERASEAGRKGGQSSHSSGGDQSHAGSKGDTSTTQHGGAGGKDSSKSGSQQGGSGNFADDPQRASEAGRKGGQQSHGGSSK